MTHVRRKFPPRRWLAPGLVAVLLFFWCVRSVLALSPEVRAKDAGNTTHLALFVTADLQGQLLPCGCSEGMRGGLGRAAAQLARARAEGLSVVYLDAGDALFARAGLQPDEAVEEERKARAVAEAMRAMGLAARATGPLDDVLGAAFRASLALPEVPDGTGRVLAVGGHRLGVVAARSAKGLGEGATQVRAAGADFVVALYGSSLDSALAAVRGVEGVDLVVTAQEAAVVTVDDDSRLVKGSPPVARVQSRGRALLRVDLLFDGKGRFVFLSSSQDVEREAATQDERIALLKKELALPGQSAERKRLLTERLATLVDKRAALAPPPSTSGANGFTVRFIPLEATLPSDAAVDAVVEKFDADVSKLNLAWARAHGRECAAPQPGEAAYVGNAVCETCHAPAFEVYRKTGHARAYQELEHVHKQYRLECVACHVVGIQQPGGVCRVDRVAGRDAVGCENCHGPGSLHAELPNVKAMPRRAPTPTVCLGCHTPENSPHFDYAVYLPRVLGPGHDAKR